MTSGNNKKMSYDWAANEVEADQGSMDWSGKEVAQQTGWDARAAGNFIGGGSGTGLLICAALVAPAAIYGKSVLLGLFLTALGLLCVLAEIGHPLRFLNVLRRGNTSWMTREALIAPFLFASGAAAAFTGDGRLTLATTVFAVAYLYCQARMLQASKGIPAWRNKTSIPLMLTTGVVEGASLVILVCLAAGSNLPPALNWLLFVALLARRIAWKRYMDALAGESSAGASLNVLRNFYGPYSYFGQALPELLLLVGIFFVNEQTVPFAIAALAGVTSGWLLKFTLVTKAAFSQGFVMKTLPIRRRQGK